MAYPCFPQRGLDVGPGDQVEAVRCAGATEGKPGGVPQKRHGMPPCGAPIAGHWASVRAKAAARRWWKPSGLGSDKKGPVSGLSRKGEAR
jgi:hypothetical protein